MDTNQNSQLSGTKTVAPLSETERRTGCQACTCTRETFGCSIHPTGRAEWIACMRASLAKILALQEREQASMESEAVSLPKCSGQLTLSGLDSCSSRTVHEFGPRGETVLLPSLWRVVTPGATEFLGRLMSAPLTTETGGGASLPTLTVCGNYNRKGASETSGDGLITALRKRPTLIARDARTAAGSQPMPGRKETSGDPLLWSMTKHLPAERRRGLRLNPMWATWFMGWPMNWFRAR